MKRLFAKGYPDPAAFRYPGPTGQPVRQRGTTFANGQRQTYSKSRQEGPIPLPLLRHGHPAGSRRFDKHGHSCSPRGRRRHLLASRPSSDRGSSERSSTLRTTSCRNLAQRKTRTIFSFIAMPARSASMMPVVMKCTAACTAVRRAGLLLVPDLRRKAVASSPGSAHDARARYAVFPRVQAAVRA